MNRRTFARPRHTTTGASGNRRHPYVRPIASGTVQCGTCRAFVKARYLTPAQTCRDCDTTSRHEQWNHSAHRRVAARLDRNSRRLHRTGGEA